ncbi:hypothetical protein OG223_52965 [Streptomyces sp. NBC_01478]|uniref:hypothetical protein n=1 Tax=Streptomyces sp. NBC_01478 TaxID=2903882 RepID=UPI002E350D18|nr:hypothetical protein [Streptomyces sp. NBC_01478]
MSPAPPPPPEPRTHRADLTSRAWAEALSMTHPHPDPRTRSGSGSGRAQHPYGELAAAALHEHSALSAALGRSVPLTALGPAGGGVRALAAFLAVYAARHEQRTAPGRRGGRDAR